MVSFFSFFFFFFFFSCGSLLALRRSLHEQKILIHKSEGPAENSHDFDQISLDLGEYFDEMGSPQKCFTNEWKGKIGVSTVLLYYF